MKKLLLLVMVCILTATACGLGDDDTGSDSEQVVVDDFPHADGAERLDAAYIEAQPYDVATSEAVAALYIIDQEAMVAGTYYGTGLLAEVDGWSGGGIGATESAFYSMYQNGQRIAMVALVPGRVFTERPELVSELDLAPFDEVRHDVKSDETLIYAQFFTCDEAAIESCLQAVFNARAPGL